MKQGELRRALLIATVLCIFLFIYLYWHQSSSSNRSPIETLVLTYKRVYSTSNKKSPQWTWHCKNQRCQRLQITKEMKQIISLATCSMLCGSTQLWPQPTGPVTLGSKAVTFHFNHFKFESSVPNGPVKNLLQNAFQVFNDSIASLIPDFNNNKNNYYYCLNDKTDFNKFIIRVILVDNEMIRLKLKTDESYNLSLKSHGNEIITSIVANNYFGARHGLETLSQLIWWDDYEGNFGALKTIKGATISDAPAFPYRGLMVDTARNFMSINSLKRVLIGMAANKLNIFHWHVSDSQSFPLILPNVPQLAKTGAYQSDATYSPEEVKALVEFARVRGIRIVIEVDVPAHAGNGWTWGPQEGLGELAVCINQRPWSLYCGEPPCGQLNPENSNVYDILEKIYRDILDLTEEREIFHLGGDEVNLECWSQHLRKSINYSDMHDLWGDFTLKAFERLHRANNNQKIPQVIVWSSRLSKRPYIAKYLNKNITVVQSWGSSQWSDTPDLLADDYRILISHVDAWYLDCGFGRWRETGDAACDPYRPWQNVYNHRPWQQMKVNKQLILGGEVCLWTEQVEETSLDSRLWPRAAAFAERVWNDPQMDSNSFTIQEDVYTRLATQRERLLSKGLQAEALWPFWCTQNPGMCL